jgi:stearoyl-CoA desaturase (delta-9 desaturase)
MIFQASTKSVFLIQLAVMTATVAGAFLVSFSFHMVMLALFMFYFYNVCGISMMFHRYWTHKSFEFRYDWMKWAFTIVACLVGKGSPIAWVYVHRLHHAHTDTAKDPHSPHFGGLRIMGFKSINLETMKVFMVRDLLNKQQKFFNDWYVALILGWALLLLVINPSLLYFAWVLPVCVLQISQDIFNYVAHVNGYRNYESNDKSTNSPILWPLILGEAWHNNHHAYPKNAKFGHKWWEFDPVFYLIRAIQK